MPASDWPPAIINGRVYTLDGTMDAKGPPTGGSDWYESRVAEPDGFLSELIAVLYPSNSEYAPSGLHNLRHAATGTIRSVKPSECADVSAPHPTRAPTCESLGAANPMDVALQAGLQAVMTRELVTSPPPPSQSPSPPSPSPPPPSPKRLSPLDTKDDNAGLYVAIAALGCLTVIGVASTAVSYLYMKKKANMKVTSDLVMKAPTKVAIANAVEVSTTTA